MITKDVAIKIAEEYLRTESISTGYKLALLDDSIIEFELGWVFFYQSKEYLETQDILHLLGGNSPIIINKNDGSIYVTGTAYPVEHYIQEYIETNK
jgi:hypothetical protein